jgi:hypothetical protein
MMSEAPSAVDKNSFANWVSDWLKNRDRQFA